MWGSSGRAGQLQSTSGIVKPVRRACARAAGNSDRTPGRERNTVLLAWLDNVWQGFGVRGRKVKSRDCVRCIALARDSVRAANIIATEVNFLYMASKMLHGTCDEQSSNARTHMIF